MRSVNTYNLPIPLDSPISLVVRDNDFSHKDEYRGSIDIAVPVGTLVLAPLGGTVTQVVHEHNRYGITKEFAAFVNYVQLEHNNSEFSDLLHLEAGSVSVVEGQSVRTGQILGRTGLSGWMTEPHLHWMVFHEVEAEPGFQAVKIVLPESDDELLRQCERTL